MYEPPDFDILVRMPFFLTLTFSDDYGKKRHTKTTARYTRLEFKKIQIYNTIITLLYTLYSLRIRMYFRRKNIFEFIYRNFYTFLFSVK